MNDIEMIVTNNFEIEHIEITHEHPINLEDSEIPSNTIAVSTKENGNGAH